MFQDGGFTYVSRVGREPGGSWSRARVLSYSCHCVLHGVTWRNISICHMSTR